LAEPAGEAAEYQVEGLAESVFVVVKAHAFRLWS